MGADSNTAAAIAAAELTRPKLACWSRPVHEIPSEPVACPSVPVPSRLRCPSPVRQPAARLLLSDLVDVSRDFRDYTNAYYLADSLTAFDPTRGTGTVKWRRHQMVPRLAWDNGGRAAALRGRRVPGHRVSRRSRARLPDRLRFAAHDPPASPHRARSAGRREELMLVGTRPRDTSWRYEAITGGHRYTSAAGSVTITAQPWHVELRDAAGRLLTRTRTLNDLSNSWCPRSRSRSSAARATSAAASAAVFELAPDEKIFGFGESFTRLNKRGQRVLAFLRDAMGVQGQLMYKPVPFFLSSRGYGMFVHTSAPVDVRRRRRVRRASHDLHRRRDAGPLRLPRRAEGRRLRVHGDHRSQPGAAALVVRALDEPHHLQVRGRGARRRRQAPRSTSARRRAPPRHRLVRDRLARRLPVLEVALHRSGEDDRRPEEGRLPHQPLAVHVLHAQERAVEGARRSGSRREGSGRPARRPRTRCSTSPTRGGGVVPRPSSARSCGWAWARSRSTSARTRRSRASTPTAAPDGTSTTSIPLRYNDVVVRPHRRRSPATASSGPAARGRAASAIRCTGAATPRTPTRPWRPTLRGGLSFGLSGFTFWSHDVGGFVNRAPRDLYRRWLAFGVLTSHTRTPRRAAARAVGVRRRHA